MKMFLIGATLPLIAALLGTAPPDSGDTAAVVRRIASTAQFGRPGVPDRCGWRPGGGAPGGRGGIALPQGGTPFRRDPSNRCLRSRPRPDRLAHQAGSLDRGARHTRRARPGALHRALGPLRRGPRRAAGNASVPGPRRRDLSRQLRRVSWGWRPGRRAHGGRARPSPRRSRRVEGTASADPARLLPAHQLRYRRHGHAGLRAQPAPGRPLGSGSVRQRAPVAGSSG